MGTCWEIAECNEALYTPPHGEKSTHNSGRHTFSVFWLLWVIASDILQYFLCSGLFRSSKDTYECMWEGSSAEQSECSGSSNVFLFLVWRRSMNSVPDARHKSVIPLVSWDGSPVIRQRVHSAVMLSPGLLVLSVWLKKEQKQNHVGWTGHYFYFFPFIILFLGRCRFFFIFTFYLRNVWVYPWTFFFSSAAAGSRYVRTIKPTNSADCYDKPRRPRSVRHISCESKQVDLEHNALQPHSVAAGGGGRV